MIKDYDFTQLEALKKRLDALRPLDAELYGKLRHKLSVDWTYHSNAIEGNTLTLSETRFFLEVGLTSKGKPLSEYLEMKNHKYAIDYLETVVKENKPLTEWLIKELHAMLFERNEDYEIENELGQKVRKNVLPGKYKQDNNYVLLPDGSRKYYMDHLKVVDAMQDLIKFYNDKKKKIHPVILAAELHAQFVSIHPFVDGNGRVARLIMNLVLMQAGYEPAIIQNELKQDYYQTLRHYDETGDIEPFVSIIEQEVMRTLQITLKAGEGGTIFKVSDMSKRLDTFAKTMHALEKDVGKFSKKVSHEDKENSIMKIRDYFASIAKEKLEVNDSELFNFEIRCPLRFDDIKDATLKFVNFLEKKGVVTELRQEGGYGPYKDFITDKENGSALCIDLKTKRAFIPTSFCYFVIIPTKYTICVCSAINVSQLNESGNEIDGETLISSIQNGVLWEDWSKEDLNHFFIEVFDQYLIMIEAEAEKRRLNIS